MSIISPETILRIEEKMRQAGLLEEDLEEHFILGAGPGGQKTNKTSSTVRLKHHPSGLIVKCAETRSRETNRWVARRLLADRLLETIEGERSARQQAIEKERRRKRTKSRRQKAKMVADKRIHAEKKAARRRPVEE